MTTTGLGHRFAWACACTLLCLGGLWMDLRDPQRAASDEVLPLGVHARPTLGEHCRALFRWAHAAETCDPKLIDARVYAQSVADEQKCAALWAMLKSPHRRESSPRSIYSVRDGPPEPEDDASSPHYHGRAPLLPARLELQPTQSWRAGHPQTTALIDGRLVDRKSDGVSATHLAAGRHNLTVIYAGTERHYCIELPSCTTLKLQTQGARISSGRHKIGQCHDLTPSGQTVASGAELVEKL